MAMMKMIVRIGKSVIMGIVGIEMETGMIVVIAYNLCRGGQTSWINGS